MPAKPSPPLNTHTPSAPPGGGFGEQVTSQPLLFSLATAAAFVLTELATEPSVLVVGSSFVVAHVRGGSFSKIHNLPSVTGLEWFS